MAQKKQQPQKPKEEPGQNEEPKPPSDPLTTTSTSEDEAARAAEFDRADEQAAALLPGSEPEVKAQATAEPEPAAEVDLEAQKMAAGLFIAEAVPFGVMAQLRGPHWKLNEEEVRALAPLWVEVLDKHWPGWYDNMGPEVQLLTVLLMAAGPRLQIDAARTESATVPTPATEPEAATEETTTHTATPV